MNPPVTLHRTVHVLPGPWEAGGAQSPFLQPLTDPQDTRRLVSPTPHCTAHTVHSHYTETGNNFTALP